MKITYVGIMDIDVKMSISEQGFKVQNTKKKIPSNRYELKVVLEDKVYPKTYYRHKLGNVVVDETLANIKAQGLQIVGWMLIEDQRLMKLNLGTNAEPQMVKINAQLEIVKVLELQQLLKEFKDVFAWTYKDLKRIPPKLAQHKIELDIIIPSTHQAKYKLNPNYAKAIKQDIDKLLVVEFIQSTWLSPIVVVPKKMAN